MAIGQSWVTLKFGGFTKTKMFDSITIWLPSRKSSSDTDTRWTIEPPSAEALGFRCYPVWPQGDGFCRWSQTPIFIFLEALKSFYLFYAGAVSLALAVWPRSCFRWGLMSSVQWVWPITVSICMDLMQSADFQLHKFTVMLAAPNMNKHSFLSCQPRSDKQWLIDKVGTLKCDSVIHHKYGPSDDQIVIWHSRRPLWLNSILNQFSLDTDLFVLFRSSRISSGRTSRC